MCVSEASSELSPMSKMELFEKIFNGIQFHLRCLTRFWMRFCVSLMKLQIQVNHIFRP